MIEMVGVSAGRAGRLQLIDCTLAVPAARIAAVVGPHNSGADLIPDILVGRRKPSRGVSQVLGFDSTRNRTAVRRRLTHIPRAGALDLNLSLRRQLSWWIDLLQIPASPADIRRALRAIEIPDRYFDQPGGTVPPEYRVLCWLALAQVRRHRVVILEHPTALASFAGADKIARVLRDLREQGVCLLTVTDDIRFAEIVADDVSLIDLGRRRATGTAARP